MKARAIILVTYFGKWPDYFDLYLYSCSKNPIVDFYYFTDCPIPEIIYANTYFISIPFSDYCKNVSIALDIDFRPSNAYKLADLKPFLAIIHADIINKYDFWGFGDIDLIYGRLSDILTTKNLNHYTAFSTHTNKISGHFCLLSRNKFKEVGFKIKDWQQMLEDETSYVLDENYLARIVYPDMRYRRGIKKILRMNHLCTILDMPRWLQWLTKKFQLECFTTSIPTKDSLYIYKDGEIIDMQTNKKLIYIHFIFFKGSPHYNLTHKWGDNYYQCTALDFGREISIDWDFIKLK